MAWEHGSGYLCLANAEQLPANYGLAEPLA
eukprot:COSAG04_NODE_31065_length_259_cov_0.543750_2_plen_29_part_01